MSLALKAQEKRRSGRLTPYGHNPRKRRSVGGEALPSCQGSSVPEGREGRKDVFKTMVGKVCRLYKVSPLWQFNSTEKALKEYSQQLTGLLSALPHPAPKGQRRASPYLGVVSGMKDSDLSSGYDIIVVQVTTGQRNSSTGTPPLCVAVLCSISQPQLKVTGFTYLPMLMLRGPASVSTVITDWLKSSFDCCITAHILDQPSLLALAECYAGKQRNLGKTREKLGGLKLIYNLPSAVQEAGLNRISLELPYDSTAALQRGDSLLDTIKDMIHTHLSLKVSSLTLIGVSAPLIQVLCNGSIKFLSTSEVFPVLSLVQ